MTKCVSLIGLVVLASLSASSADPFINSLHALQTATGGFREPTTEVPDLESTAHGLLLASLYGQKAQINVDDAAQFVQTLQDPKNFGYGLTAGAPSDLASTRYALSSYIHLGKAIPNSAQVSDFIRSLSDVSTGLFKARAGEGTDYRSTALAIETLDLTGELQKPAVQEVLKRVKDSLSDKVSSSETNIRFSLDAQSQTPVSDNYYAIYLAKKSGFKFNDVEKWAEFITAQQDLDRQSPTYGGFFSDLDRKIVSAEATAHAALSLHLLEQDAGNEYALYQYTQSRKSTLKETALSHLAFAHARVFKRAFTTTVGYDSDGTTEIEQQIMEGLRILPTASVTVFEGKVAHGGFNVIVKEAGGYQSELEYNTDRRLYVAKNYFDTTSKLGPVAFSFELSTTVFPIGDVRLSATDKKSVGYQMQVQAQATYAGRSLEAGESVPPGTEFTFDISFSTRSNPQFITGPFVVDFQVVDSSEVSHFQSNLEGSANSKPIVFGYVLSGEDFTSGAINFLITVRNEEGAHSFHSVSYSLDQQMVAAGVTFEGFSATAPKNFGVGDKLKVTIQPASLKDLHSVAPFLAENAAKRTFVMDLSTVDGTTYLSVPGTPSGSNFEFESTIPATLDAIGASVVSFRFVAVSGKSITLHPFDTQANELVEDASSIQIAVGAELHAAKFEKKPTTTKFTYGTDIPFEFVLTDSVSGKEVSAGKLGQVKIVLTVGTGANAFESGSVVAVSSGEGNPFSAILEIDANTAKGDGEITIKGNHHNWTNFT